MSANIKNSVYGMAGNWFVSGAVVCAFLLGCPAGKDPESRKSLPLTSPIVVLSPRPQALSQEQRNELAFPPELIEQVESISGSKAEAFYAPVMSPSENLKGDVMLTRHRLAGFSIRTTKSEKIMNMLSDPLHQQGFLIFRSEQNYGKVPDVITVIRGKNEYEILAVQKTEAHGNTLSTEAIIKWLKAKQRKYPFKISGAGADWVETRFIRPPKNFNAFAREIQAFAPDVVSQGTKTIEKLAEEMKESNGFYLWWD